MNNNNHKIIVNNFNNSETVCYSVILLKGEIFSNLNSKCSENSINFQINNETFTSTLYNNKFEQLIQLSLGENNIQIYYCCSICAISITFTPKITNYCVVPVYIVCKNHDGTFQSPENIDNSITSACSKISTASKLIQCLFAEKFYENGLERKTFQLQSDLDKRASDCIVFHSNYDVDSVRKMSADEIWYNFGRELLAYNPNKHYKYLAFVSCTKYKGNLNNENALTHDDIIKLTEAHVALGGGGLAIFGSACLYTWPSNIKEVVDFFENETKVDKTKYMDDSCYRGTYGGCFATTLGAVCHELCHTFDLGHTDEGIMGRGFDDINKEFTFVHKNIQKDISKLHSNVLHTPNNNVMITQNVLPIFKRLNPHPIKINSNKINKRGIYWTRSCLMLLYHHRWLNKVKDNNHSIVYKDMTLYSTAGICIVEIRNVVSGLVLKWWEFDAPVYEFQIEENLDFGIQEIVIVAEDIVNNIITQKL